MELVNLSTDKLDKLQAVIDLVYVEESGDFAAKYFPVQAVYINRQTQRILNPHTYSAMKQARPTAAEMPCILVDIAPDDEIGAAIALCGGVDGLLAGRPATADANQQLVKYIMKTFNTEREKLFGLGPDAEYWLDFIDFIQGNEDETEDEPLPLHEPVTLHIPTGLESDFPVIDISKQATVEDVTGVQWETWGRKGRAKPAAAVHFYTDDKRFAAIESQPQQVTTTGAKLAVEPNYSIHEYTPLTIALADLWRKRQMNHWFQEAGIRTLVDMNVPREFFDHVFYGVPKGWTAYANKYYKADSDHLLEAYEIAQQHAGTDAILYIVFGTEGARAICEANNWIHVLTGIRS